MMNYDLMIYGEKLRNSNNAVLRLYRAAPTPSPHFTSLHRYKHHILPTIEPETAKIT
ncbi:hypothetical protein CANCADRAFT_31415 [Tortispora caseinolytica NRRL Y-17796]|uniref:Uncharacterized protein n=1 Tax=Tortispora caseinolytica NRRL Y-17796 TaxID=767744 RepID=A0A1E4TFA2_9ASCO|nr:hypothetical protein CANCADRAFT_31415 [Tortispora caseinolytica NRRL Y-17796]